MKKIISMLLVIVMTVTFILPVMAADSTASADEALKKVITVVKEKISIPADCKLTSYNVYTQNGISTWSLNWTNEEAQKYIYVTIDDNNFITNYSSYQYNTYEKKLPKYSKQEGQAIAEKFVNNLDPKILSEFKLEESNNYSQDREYYFNYVRQHSGIKFSFNGINVTVNNYTGQVTNYSCNYNKDTVFEDASKIISLEQAKKAFIDKLGLKLIYSVKSDKDKLSTYLAYVPKDSNKYIDAITGNVEANAVRYGIAYDENVASMKMAASTAAGAVVLTPEELDAVKSLSGLLSKEEIDKKLRAVSLFGIDSDFKITSSELRKDWRDNETLIWSFSYQKTIDKEKNLMRDINVTVDAKTGEILSFWTYYQAAEGAKALKTKEEAKAISDDAVKTLLAGKYDKFKYDASYYGYEDPNQSQFTFRYVRVENNLECPNDYVTVTYDNLTGKVTNFSVNWSKNLTFDDPAKAISIDKAYDVLFNKIGYGVEYISDNSDVNAKIITGNSTLNNKAVLGYFINNSKPCIISGTTGDILNNSGTVYQDNAISDYTDIKGLSAENKVKILTQLGIKYVQNELKPNEALLQKDYFVILSRLNDLYYFDQSIDEATAVERMYNNLISSGIITKEDKKPDAALTREEAAKYFVKFLRMGQVAEIKGIFKSDFKDANKINPELLGYVCIASGLKAMNGSNGNFNPKNKITRLEGLLSIYSYLDNK